MFPNIVLKVDFESKQLCEPVFALSSTKVAWYNCNKQTDLTILQNYCVSCEELHKIVKFIENLV